MQKAKSGRTARKSDTRGNIASVIVLGLIAWAVIANDAPDDGDASPAAPADAASLTLADFAGLKPDARADLVAREAAALGAPASDIAHFVACMGENAAIKNGDLGFLRVLGWCDAERLNDRAAFEAHFNELDARGDPTFATVACRNAVRDQLIDPGSASFPWVADTVVDRRRDTYLVKSRVTAANAAGGRQEMAYRCEIRYRGDGNVADAESWQLLSLSFG